MRKKRLYANTFFSIINQLVIILCGFILPRFILKQYGSEVNGLVSSITQFLGFISMLDLGVGAVVQSTLYGPLASNDNDRVSIIFNSAKKFFRTIALILVLYVIALSFIYPAFINSSFDTFYTVSLILVISISSFVQYYFAVPHQLLLSADQRIYIQYNIQTITIILNTVISIILIDAGFSIQFVKFVSVIVLLIRPLYISIYVKNNYHINNALTSKTEQIDQKWNGMAQHSATVVMNSVDIIMLSLFSSLSDVSVYSVYNLVLTGIKQFISVLSNAFMSLFGDMLVKKETKLINETFDSFEWFIHTVVVFVFSLTAILIVPFVMIYTKGIEDANYEVPVFAMLICIAIGIYCLRIPYNTIISAACHYRETQKSAVIEMIINIVLSLILVKQFGLVGVAVGTIFAMLYRTIYFVWYLSKNILYRKVNYFIKHILIDLVQVLMIIPVAYFVKFELENYIDWIELAFIYAVFAGFCVVFANYLFYKKEMALIRHKLIFKQK